mmetsp:Transcript_174800/g.554737  ORF Transcript_174800/g.554737 Transcript_174800/m.554737 type:complete len:269 (+) Transcript_174800:324-1130(+)
MHREEECHGRKRLLAPRQQVHVAEALGGGHGGELDAAIEGILGVLQVQVGRAALRMQSCGVGRELLVDVANLACDLLEAIQETFLAVFPHNFELSLDLLDVSPRDVGLPRGVYDVLGDAMDLLNGLQVRAQAMHLDAQALQLATVLLLQHLCRWPLGCSLLLLGQRGEVHCDIRSLVRAGRGLLRGSARLLAGAVHEVLEGVLAAVQQGHLDVLEHTLAQNVCPRPRQRPFLGVQVVKALLDNHHLLTLLFRLLPQLRECLLLLALQV